MPAWRLDEADQQVTQYDVGAVDGDSTHFIKHVLLCEAEQPANVCAKSSTVTAIHMGPPLERSSKQIDVLGKADLDNNNISSGERRQIKTFVDDRLLELEAQKKTRQYIIHPAAKEPDKDCSHWRFNCAGFVLNAYIEANIELVDQENVPEIPLEVLKKAYSSVEKLLDSSSFQAKMGIATGNQWPVLLAGYIVNSLNRSAEEIRRSPYRPCPGDQFFPSDTSD